MIFNIASSLKRHHFTRWLWASDPHWTSGKGFAALCQCFCCVHSLPIDCSLQSVMWLMNVHMIVMLSKMCVRACVRACERQTCLSHAGTREHNLSHDSYVVLIAMWCIHCKLFWYWSVTSIVWAWGTLKGGQRKPKGTGELQRASSPSEESNKNTEWRPNKWMAMSIRIACWQLPTMHLDI